MRVSIFKLLPNVLNKKVHEELYLNNEYIYLDIHFGYIVRFKLESDNSKLRCVGIFEENKIEYFIFKKENSSNLLLCKNDGILENSDKIICLSTKFEVGDYVANTCLAGIVKVNAMEGSCLEYTVSTTNLSPQWELVHTNHCHRLATEDEIKVINEFKEVFNK